MQQHHKVRARIASLRSDDRIVICAIVRGEVLYGLARMSQGKKRRALETKAANLFAVIPCEPVPEKAADLYARIKREVERQGTPLDENDLWIAATAQALGAILVSSDSDFQKVKGLHLENWTA